MAVNAARCDTEPMSARASSATAGTASQRCGSYAASSSCCRCTAMLMALVSTALASLRMGEAMGSNKTTKAGATAGASPGVAQTARESSAACVSKCSASLAADISSGRVISNTTSHPDLALRSGTVLKRTGASQLSDNALVALPPLPHGTTTGTEARAAAASGSPPVTCWRRKRPDHASRVATAAPAMGAT